MGERRETRKRETRQRISDVATELFVARGFDAVTLDEVASGAGVSKMTVFNYFPRKEGLLFDREDDLLLVPLRTALRGRPDGQRRMETLRRLLVQLRDAENPIAHIHPRSVEWWRVVAASSALQARLRELEDQAADGLAAELAGVDPDGPSRLAAGMIVLTLRLAREEAIRVLASGGSPEDADNALLRLAECGFRAVDGVLG
jgi:AcrR family transcriptional regulator